MQQCYSGDSLLGSGRKLHQCEGFECNVYGDLIMVSFKEIRKVPGRS